MVYWLLLVKRPAKGEVVDEIKKIESF